MSETITPKDRARQLLGEWRLKHYFSQPIHFWLDDLVRAVATAIAEAEAEAYERGYQAGRETNDST